MNLSICAAGFPAVLEIAEIQGPHAERRCRGGQRRGAIRYFRQRRTIDLKEFTHLRPGSSRAAALSVLFAGGGIIRTSVVFENVGISGINLVCSRVASAADKRLASTSSLSVLLARSVLYFVSGCPRKALPVEGDPPSPPAPSPAFGERGE